MGKILLVLASLLVCQLCITVVVDAQINYVNRACSVSRFNYTKGSVYEKNLEILFNRLTSKSTSYKFNYSAAGNVPNKVYGLYQCRDDIDLDVCSECVKNATLTIIEKCPSYPEAIVWYYECMLRYANQNISSMPDTSPGAYRWSLTNVSNYADFAPELGSQMNQVIKNASSATSHFASRETNVTMFSQLHSFAQCTPNINNSRCEKCLRTALYDMTRCCNASVYAMVVFPSCQLRYNTTNIILNDNNPASTNQAKPTSTKSSSMKGIIVALVVCVSFGLIALSVVLWICLSRKKSGETSSSVPLASSPRELHDGPASANGYVESFGGRECVEYDFATLKTATGDFSDENMLGEGAFGIVYKGTLENGQQVAIKRLSRISGLETMEFITEARLLADIQHKNLVRLVGFCSERDDNLLVYEYMSNASIDRILFDAKKRPLLDWVTRYKIILGIARGLQYLHEDSQLNIVHHDLKPSNILLDNEMNPKIAGFGLAKFFEGEQTRRDTGHTGRSKGYMAPEYTITGDSTEKSDVYSFGIMVLEIVSGQKNRIIFQAPLKEDLPLHAWRLWVEGRSFDLTDSALYNNCSSNDVIKCIQIGLLCVEANAEQRPTMTEVVHMLTDSVDLPPPSTPAMYVHQFSMTDSHTSEKQSDSDQPSAKMVTWRSELDQDLYPRPS